MTDPEHENDKMPKPEGTAGDPPRKKRDRNWIGFESVLAPLPDEWGHHHDLDYSRLTPQEALYVDQVKEAYEEDRRERKERESGEHRGDGHD
jgi:hypothetical protein